MKSTFAFQSAINQKQQKGKKVKNAEKN